MEIGSFKIPGHATRRHWGVYIFKAVPKDDSRDILLYVGKVGDNRAGCNPVISRVGNHFSYNKVHSQIRNKIDNPEEYDYEYYYCHFDEYEEDCPKRSETREKINELERELNRLIQQEFAENEKSTLLNPYYGKYISNKEKIRRSFLVDSKERNALNKLIIQLS